MINKSVCRYAPAGFPLGRVCFSSAALRWRAGVRAELRFECVLSSGALRVVSRPVCYLRAAAFQCRALCAGSGVLSVSAFLSDDRWVCSSIA